MHRSPANSPWGVRGVSARNMWGAWALTPARPMVCWLLCRVLEVSGRTPSVLEVILRVDLRPPISGA